MKKYTIYKDPSLYTSEEEEKIINEYMQDYEVDKQEAENMFWNMEQDTTLEDIELAIDNNIKKDKEVLITGTLGLWNGRHKIYPTKADNLYKAICKCSGDGYLQVEQTQNKVYITLCHHDGTNYFTISQPKSYEQKKNEARQEAINWQHESAEKNYSYQDMAYFGEKFTKLAKRFGLVKEFKENCII